MAWLRFLNQLSLVISVGTDVLILFYVYPAFQRTRNKAFVLIAIACVLGIIDTVYDHIVVTTGMSNSDYIFARTFRRFTYFANVVLSTPGTIMLVQSYLSKGARVKDSPNDQETPTSSL